MVFHPQFIDESSKLHNDNARKIIITHNSSSCANIWTLTYLWCVLYAQYQRLFVYRQIHVQGNTNNNNNQCQTGHTFASPNVIEAGKYHWNFDKKNHLHSRIPTYASRRFFFSSYKTRMTVIRTDKNEIKLLCVIFVTSGTLFRCENNRHDAEFCKNAG